MRPCGSPLLVAEDHQAHGPSPLDSARGHRRLLLLPAALAPLTTSKHRGKEIFSNLF